MNEHKICDINNSVQANKLVQRMKINKFYYLKINNKLYAASIEKDLYDDFVSEIHTIFDNKLIIELCNVSCYLDEARKILLDRLNSIINEKKD